MDGRGVVLGSHNYASAGAGVWWAATATLMDAVQFGAGFRPRPWRPAITLRTCRIRVNMY